MFAKVETGIDGELVQEAIRRYRLADSRAAVHLALRTLLDLDAGDAADPVW